MDAPTARSGAKMNIVFLHGFKKKKIKKKN
jgi:hypothetical protein